MGLTRERLKELLVYNKYTGEFVWNTKRNNRINKGDKAGCINGKGYVTISIDSVCYLAHRLAFLYEKGTSPKLIDHINRNKQDNSFKNLRSCSYKENNLNRKFNSKFGISGVYYREKYNHYRVVFNGKEYPTFKNLDDAITFSKGLRKEGINDSLD